MQVLKYNVPGGKMVRALITYATVMALEGKDTPGVKEKAMGLAWTQEMVTLWRPHDMSMQPMFLILQQ